MAVIEGIGDEVLTFFIVVAIIAVAVLAWISTNTAERPLLRTVLILERHQPRAVPSPPPSTAEPASSPQEKPPDSPSTSVSSAGSNVQAVDNVEESMSSYSDGLRIIRLSERNAPDSSDNNDTEERLLSETRDREEQAEILRLMDDHESSPPSSEGADEEETSHSNAATEPGPADGADQPASIRINLKYLNDDLRSVQGSLQEQVGDFKKRNFSTELSARSIVRLVFNGKLLGQDTQTLGNYGLHDNCVVHCLVHQQRTPPVSPSSTTTAHAAPEAPLGIGHSLLTNILLVALSCMLGVAWYGRYHYAQWFTATSTVALVGVTGLFTVFLIGIYIPENNQI